MFLLTVVFSKLFVFFLFLSYSLKLEEDPLYNAGRGAVFNDDGGHELDASIMDGRDLSCGAVAGVTTVRNPIKLARLVKEKTEHVLLQGEEDEKDKEKESWKKEVNIGVQARKKREHVCLLQTRKHR